MSPPGDRPVMLVDAAGLYFRAFHGVPRSVRSPDGVPVNAVRGFLDMTATLFARFRPYAYAACLDLSWRPAFRVAALPSYKSHRLLHPGDVREDAPEDVPAELLPQVPVLLEALAALGLRTVGAAGYEADDVIATLAARACGAGEDVLVVTGDRDLLALARSPAAGQGSVSVVWVGKGVAKAEVLDEAAVCTRYGVPSAAAYLDMAILRGDPSDGLPGVAGVGEKTAAALVRRFGTVTDVLAAARAGQDGFSPGARAGVLAAAEYLTAAVAVVPPVTDVPLGAGRALGADVTDGAAPGTVAPIPAEPADPAALVALSDRWGLDAPLSRVLAAMRGCAGDPTPSSLP